MQQSVRTVRDSTHKLVVSVLYYKGAFCKCVSILFIIYI